MRSGVVFLSFLVLVSSVHALALWQGQPVEQPGIVFTCAPDEIACGVSGDAFTGFRHSCCKLADGIFRVSRRLVSYATSSCDESEFVTGYQGNGLGADINECTKLALADGQRIVRGTALGPSALCPPDAGYAFILARSGSGWVAFCSKAQLASAAPSPTPSPVPVVSGQCTVTTTTTCRRTVTETVSGVCSGSCQPQCPTGFTVSSSTCQGQASGYGLLCLGGSVSCQRTTQSTYTSTSGCQPGDVALSASTVQTGCEPTCVNGVLYGQQGACVNNACQYSGGTPCPVPPYQPGAPYCDGNDVVRDDLVYAPSCNGPACSSTSSKVRYIVASCEFGCDAATATCNLAPSPSPSASPLASPSPSASASPSLRPSPLPSVLPPSSPPPGGSSRTGPVSLPQSSVFRLVCPTSVVVDPVQDVSVFFVENGETPRCVSGVSVAAVSNETSQDVVFVSCNGQTGEHVFEVSTKVKLPYNVTASYQGFWDSCSFPVAGSAPTPVPELDALGIVLAALAAAFVSRKR